VFIIFQRDLKNSPGLKGFQFYGIKKGTEKKAPPGKVFKILAQYNNNATDYKP